MMRLPMTSATVLLVPFTLFLFAIIFVAVCAYSTVATAGFILFFGTFLAVTLLWQVNLYRRVMQRVLCLF